MSATIVLRELGEIAASPSFPQLNLNVPTEAIHQQVRLRDAKAVFRCDALGQDEAGFRPLLSQFSRWVSESTFLLLQEKSSGDIIYKYASKRGNYVYQERVRRRMEKAAGWVSEYSGNPNHFLFITLTLNPDLFFGHVSRAWESIAHYYNRFTIALRHKYGKVWILRAFEAHENGFPHVHMVVYVPGHQFHTFQHNGRTRVKEYKEIKRLWGYGHSDIQGVPSRGGVKVVTSYIMKDVLKSYTTSFAHADYKSQLTLAMNWLFQKQSFAVSGSRLVPIRHNSTEIPALELYDSTDFEFLGMFVLKFHDNTIPPPIAGVIKYDEIENIPGLDRFYETIL